MSKLPTKIDVDIFSKANESDTLDSLFAQKINAIISYLSEQGEEKKSLDNSVDIAGQTYLKSELVQSEWEKECTYLEGICPGCGSVGDPLIKTGYIGEFKGFVRDESPVFKSQSITADVKIPIAGDGKVPDHLEKNAPHVVVGDGAPVESEWEKQIKPICDGFDEWSAAKGYSQPQGETFFAVKGLINSLLTTARQEEAKKTRSHYYQKTWNDAVDAERERVKGIVRNMPPYRKTNNHDRLVYEEVLSDILTAIN